ncbi:MAG TPA: hypothetical protein PLZ95_01250 [Bryobacteraceae bacterium]|nr:hypothetical protein [Bryobacteraceae bacterium]
MVDRISRYLDRAIDEARRKRTATSPVNAEDRKEFRSIIGVVDQRIVCESPKPDSTVDQDAIVGRTPNFDVIAVRWPTLAGVDGEGLLLRPRRKNPVANVIAIPEAGWTPEMLAGLEAGIPPGRQFARLLAELGVQVMVPVIMDRRDTYSGNPSIRMTNQPHREFIYRMSFEMGRHVIGYEVQKVLSYVDWFARAFPSVPIGVAGYGEGGLLAFYSAAADERIGAALVSGYFGPREALWAEPIYRNVWNLVGRFGDAGVARLVAPRRLIVEASQQPRIDGPPPPRSDRRGAAPGAIHTPALAEVQAEFERAAAAFPKGAATLIASGNGDGPPASREAMSAFAGALGIQAGFATSAGAVSVIQKRDGESRFQRQFNQLVEFSQAIVRRSHTERQRFWSKADSSSIPRWEQTSEWYRNYLWGEVIGKLPPANGPVRALTRMRSETPQFVEWEVQIPVYPDVYAYGILLIPNNLKPGERRPVVVCQHGLEGRPSDLVDPPDGKGPYHRFAARLAEQGYITFSPQNPYLGGDRFRLLQRKANSIKLSLFSFILSQHDRLLDWLATQSYVDSNRIGFYGLSYGGKTAVRVPPILKRYALSICSGDFNDWIPKVTANDVPFSYVFTGEWEMQEWNLGNTFNYSELASLMLPRPFMVERGHRDGVGIDEWVAFEYAPVRRIYTTLGIPGKTELEYFDGPHEIHGVGTFQFLARHLK